jgi:hypothetical protein
VRQRHRREHIAERRLAAITRKMRDDDVAGGVVEKKIELLLHARLQ